MLKIKSIKPVFNKIVCTADKYEIPQYIPGTTIVDGDKKTLGLKEYQTVLMVGPDVTAVTVGEVIVINPAEYMVKKYSKDTTKSQMSDVYNPVIEYNFNIVLVNGQECLILKERDIDYIVTDSEEIEDSVDIQE
jgi:hypothetical protein